MKKCKHGKKLCRRCSQAKWAKEHYIGPEKARAWRLKNPEQAIFLRARNRARRDGILFTITVDDILIPKICPVFGTHLEHSRENAPSLDRRINSKGYVPGNVFVISGRANRLKSDASADELRRLYLYTKNRC
jgi:hypothetical protein